MRRGHSVRVDPDHPKYEGKRPWQYEWLAAGLRRHRPGFDGGWPWWLRCDEPDLDHLRTTTLPGGREPASIELELPEDRYVTFPLWMWETIYTGHYLASTRESFEDWYRELHSALPERDVWPLPRTSVPSSTRAGFATAPNETAVRASGIAMPSSPRRALASVTSCGRPRRTWSASPGSCGRAMR